jgi:hypothetical protein
MNNYKFNKKVLVSRLVKINTSREIKDFLEKLEEPTVNLNFFKGLLEINNKEFYLGSSSAIKKILEL